MTPYESVSACPACGALRVRDVFLSYCDSECLRGVTTRGETDWIDTQAAGGDNVPHLHITCGRCHFEWIEQTATDVRPIRDAR